MIDELNDDAIHRRRIETEPYLERRQSKNKKSGIRLTLEDSRDCTPSRTGNFNPESSQKRRREPIFTTSTVVKSGKRDHKPYISKIELGSKKAR